MVTRGEGAGGGVEWEVGVSRCMILYMEWVNNKDLLYRTGNYTQYLQITYNAKGSEKEYVYMCTHIYIHTHTYI